jgi:hypothetical protein
VVESLGWRLGWVVGEGFAGPSLRALRRLWGGWGFRAVREGVVCSPPRLAPARSRCRLGVVRSWGWRLGWVVGGGFAGPSLRAQGSPCEDGAFPGSVPRESQPHRATPGYHPKTSQAGDLLGRDRSPSGPAPQTWCLLSQELRCSLVRSLKHESHRGSLLAFASSYKRFRNAIASLPAERLSLRLRSSGS